jgi:hypothetical protein
MFCLQSKLRLSLVGTKLLFVYLIKVCVSRHQVVSLYLICSSYLQGGGLICPDNSVSSPADLFSFSHVRNAARLEDSRLGALRTASRSEHGLRATVDEQIGSWQKAREQEALDFKDLQIMHPHIGIGLPMSYIFATYGCRLFQFLSHGSDQCPGTSAASWKWFHLTVGVIAYSCQLIGRYVDYCFLRHRHRRICPLA